MIQPLSGILQHCVDVLSFEVGEISKHLVATEACGE